MNKEAFRIRKMGTKLLNKKIIKLKSDYELRESTPSFLEGVCLTTYLPSSHVPYYVDAHGEVHRRQL